MVRDSNPRNSCLFTGFVDRRLKPPEPTMVNFATEAHRDWPSGSLSRLSLFDRNHAVQSKVLLYPE
jgi:hypothetical protein